MIKKDISDLFSDAYDKITVMKGFLELQIKKKNVDCSFILLKELNELERITDEFYDLLMEQDKGNREEYDD